MASSIVHLAITNELIKQREFRSTNRLKFGALLPDFGTRSESHLSITLQDGAKKAYDLQAFRTRFGDRIPVDELYLGYYLHLIQDTLYRRFVYIKHGWDPKPEGNIKRLHNDYSIMNRYIIEKHGLINDIAVPYRFEAEEINELSAFDTFLLIKSVDEFFTAVPSGEVFFFTKEMTDEFIDDAVGLCLSELDRISEGSYGVDMYEFAWKRN